MPTYDYRCKECGYEFEMYQTMSAQPIKECPNCKGEVKRLIGAGAGPIFKGSGFYQTDYKNSKSNDSKEKDKASPKVDPPKTDKKSE